ncbi:MAG: DsrE family protein [Euryarchaeota archaeon]|nr:DsrE family protein [Euryarchaeota archaeon]
MIGMGKLGVFVCTDKHGEDVEGLVKAAIEKGHEVKVFFTGPGVKLVPTEHAKEIVKAGADVAMCLHSFEELGLIEKYEIPEGIKKSTQDFNANMMKEVDRYVVF